MTINPQQGLLMFYIFMGLFSTILYILVVRGQKKNP